jgi:hypothetical protein
MTGSCTTDKKGDPHCAKLGAECVATIDLYCSTEAGGPPTMCSDCLAAWPAKLSQANCPKDATGAFDSALLSYCEGLGPAGPFSNEDQGSASMDCKSFLPTRCVRAPMRVGFRQLPAYRGRSTALAVPSCAGCIV